MARLGSAALRGHQILVSGRAGGAGRAAAPAEHRQGVIISRPLVTGHQHHHTFCPLTRDMCPVCAWCVPCALGATCPRHCPLAGLVAYGDHRRQFTSRMEPVVKRTIYDQQPPTAARGTALSLQLKYKTGLKTNLKHKRL